MTLAKMLNYIGWVIITRGSKVSEHMRRREKRDLSVKKHYNIIIFFALLRGCCRPSRSSYGNPLSGTRKRPKKLFFCQEAKN